MSAATPSSYPTTPTVDWGDLPQPLVWPDGQRVATPDAWPARAAAWREMIVALEYGGLPPQPTKVAIASRAHANMRRWEEGARLNSYGVQCHGGAYPITLSVQVLAPVTPGPHPVIICGDGCWSYITDDIARRVINSGYALATFNRTELAEDLGYAGVSDKHQRTGGLYEVYPDQGFGAIAAWAWGYHRCVDLMATLPFIDDKRIAITGHSRGAKATLLAGATDERISLTHDNASCAGGSAAFRYIGHGGETIGILDMFPSWFGTGLRQYMDNVSALPFDQNCLLAAIAPRALLLTYALDDRWSNPEGMVLAAASAREVYAFLGAPKAFAYHLRPGGHFHGPEDWDRLLEFANWQWQGREPRSDFNQHPYAHLEDGS